MIANCKVTLNYVHTEFRTWKEGYESTNKCWFVKGSGNKGAGTYYYCNRTGHYKSRGLGKRHLKSQGSSKLGLHCTAAMTVQKESEGCIKVTLYMTHYGHEHSLCHLRIPEAERLAIAGKLSQGIDIQRILDDIRDNLGKSCQRIHLLTRKDITNIETAYCLRGLQRHKDDATSIHLWVEEMKTLEDNPVLLYKAQGQENTQGCDSLSPKDFILALQTPLQADLLTKFGCNRVICVDSTHGTNGYDFTLITIMVIDEYGEGVPVAWCIANREDHPLLVHFYHAVHQKVGHINPKWFMSDLAEQFYSAWVSVFRSNPPPHRLLCAWHVDQAWRKNLKQFTDNHLKASIYHNLRVLLEETDINKFEVLLENTITGLKSSATTASFADYFSTYYGRRKEEWAVCYRKDSMVNTNMYVEAFHRVLKYLYLKGKVNKRLDKCVGILLKLARDKGFERLVKLEKGKNSERIHQIRARHQTSLKLPLSLVTVTEEYLTWEVQSADGKDIYHISQLHQKCPYNCSINCEDCHICIHNYTCNCPDALVRATICKHIHLLKRFLSDTSQTYHEESHQNFQQVEETVLLEKLPTKTCQLTSCKTGIQNQLATLAGYLNTTTNISTLHDVKSLLNSAINLMKAKENIPAAVLPDAINQPPNKHIATQRPFFSTKRKRKPANTRLAKPTTEEKMDIYKSLLQGSSSQVHSPLNGNTYSEWQVLTYSP